jgi:hypothetical protein
MYTPFSHITRKRLYKFYCETYFLKTLQVDVLNFEEFALHLSCWFRVTPHWETIFCQILLNRKNVHQPSHVNLFFVDVRSKKFKSSCLESYLYYTDLKPEAYIRFNQLSNVTNLLISLIKVTY